MTPPPITPCPWCGYADLIVLQVSRRPASFRVRCPDCDIAGPRAYSAQQAAHLWDQRHQEPEDYVLVCGTVFYAGDGTSPVGGPDLAHRYTDRTLARWIASEINVSQHDPNLHWSVIPVPLFETSAALRAA